MVGVGFLILFLCIGLPLLLMPKGDFQFKWPMLFPVVICLFFTWVMVASLFKFFIAYTITPRTIEIYLPPFHRRRLFYSDIKSIEVLDAEASKKVFEDSMKEQNNIQQSMDLDGYIRMIRRKSPHYKYLSVTPRATVVTKGRHEQIKKVKVSEKEKMVLLTLKDGSPLYLSPDDAEGFAEVVLGKIK